MADARPPSRAVLVISALFTQLAGAACLVLGLASFPVMHDLHRPLSLLVAWVAAALGALLFGGLSYRGRVVPLAFAAMIDGAFGYALPRKDSALGALAQLLPQDDVALADSVVTGVAIGMFVLAGLCLVSIPFAIRYRRWETTDEGIRVTGMMMAVTPADTLKGVGRVGAKPAPKTMVIHTSALNRRSRPWVIGLVAATLVGTGLAVMIVGGVGERGAHSGGGSGGGAAVASAHAGSGRPTSSPPSKGSAAPTVDAGVASAAAPDASAGSAGSAGSDVNAVPADAPVAVAAPASPEALMTALHEAVGRGDAAALGALLAPDAFAIGPDADELADGRDAVLALLARAAGAGATVEAAHTTIGHEGKLAWIAEELALGLGRRYVTTAIASADSAGAWRVAALTWAVAVDNDTAFRLARDRKLPIPGAVADRTATAPELAAAARTAFATRDGFAAARSVRRDAFNYGSAPGERMIGGAGIQRAFARMNVDMGLHDGITVAALGDKAGWSEANIDFTAPDKDGAQVTQTFRVLAAWLREDAGWRIVQTQFSNARPR